MSKCPHSRRGHTWRPLNAAMVKLASAHVSPEELAAMRTCATCGEIGRVNKQGVVESGEKLRRA